MVHKATPAFLQMTKNAAPTNPAAGHIGVYFKSSDGLLYQRNSAGNEYPIGGKQITRDEFGQETELSADKLVFPRATVLDLTGGLTRLANMSSSRRRRAMIVTAHELTPFVSAVNMPNLSLLSGTGSVVNQTDSQYSNYATGAVSGNSSGLTVSSPLHVPIVSNPTFEAVIRTGTLITLCRIWIGLFASAPNNADTLTPVGIGFRFNGTLGWTPCVFDGLSQTTGSTIGTVVLSTAYLLRFRILLGDIGGSVAFSVNDGAEQVLGGVPIGGRLSMAAVIYTNSAAIRNLLVSRMSTESD